MAWRSSPDTFSGDAIPVHLLTREAIDLYWEHLKPDGILAFHISNLHFNLTDVVRVHPRNKLKQAIPVMDEDNSFYDSQSRWVLVTSNLEFLLDPKVFQFPTSSPPPGRGRFYGPTITATY